jgi:glucokinase
LKDTASLQKKSSLGKVLKEKGAVTAADIAEHAKKGDRFAKDAWEEACGYLAMACVNVCHFTDPQMIVLAGGMSQAGDFLVGHVVKHFKEQWWKMAPAGVNIALAKLGNDAGVIGAAGVAKDAFDRKALPEIGR